MDKMKELRTVNIETDGKFCSKDCRWLVTHVTRHDGGEEEGYCSLVIPDIELEHSDVALEYDGYEEEYERHKECLKEITLIDLIYQGATQKGKEEIEKCLPDYRFNGEKGE
jgi:hypothetical protein